MNKYLFLILFLSCSFTLIAQDNVIDEVVWVVGDEPILKSEIETARLEARAQGQTFEGDPYSTIAENMAIQKLFLHQAELDSIELTDAEIFREVDMRIEYFEEQFGSREKMEEYFQKPYSQIRELLYNSVHDNNMVDEVKRNLIKDVHVTPAQVRKYFKDVPEDSIPYIPTQLEVQIIQCNPRVAQEEVDRIKDLLREYTERINSGESFATIARLYSEDGSASKGGELGFSSRAQWVPEFAAVAFNLTNPKAVSKIVETEYGYHILQLIEKKGDQVNVRHILKKPRISQESIDEGLSFLDSISGCIKNGEYTFDEAASRFSQDKDTRMNYGNMVKWLDMYHREGSTRFEMRDLPTEVARVVSNMKVGDISKPFVMMGNSGKEVVAIVKLKNKIEGHKASMVDDYQTLQNIVLDKYSEDKIENWIREKQKTTYVRINDDWKNRDFKYPGWIK
ncbi:MAG: peptidylprolyl isomerase [Prevotellaceae bacterium]|nr:peptidylprolyl isomerase [Candidatus Colivivens equi]MCQ2076608.1 peptidylprolyl isomerase [Bacteroidaceae bacterium]